MIIVVTEEGIEVNGILLKSTGELQALIAAHAPATLQVDLTPIPPKDLYVSLFAEAFYFKSDLYAYINMHAPKDLDVYLNIISVKDLYTTIGAHPPSDFTVHLRIWQTAIRDLEVWITACRTGTLDLQLLMYIWQLKDLYVDIAGHAPFDLSLSLHGWIPYDINALIDSVFPETLPVTFIATPEAGVDLMVLHNAARTTDLSVTLSPWTTWKHLSVSLVGMYASDLSVNLSMGAYHDLSVIWPGTGGYLDLNVIIRPSIRVVSTMIAVCIMESKDLYVSINQGWPCGFGSSYKNLEVVMTPAYFHALEVSFVTIHGSGYKNLGVYINQSHFESYLNSFDLNINLPAEEDPPDIKIPDKQNLTYNNQFDTMVQDRIVVRFSWPRVKNLTSIAALAVSFIAYLGDPWHDLSVTFVAARPIPPRQAESQPEFQARNEDPVWPAYFQAHEIELWSKDPPELVRRVEIKFDEQIKEYYWLSSEQRAYAKEIYDRWCWLTRGYLPNAEYSGQIDYVTMRTLCSMQRYDTIDDAVRAMIKNFLYSDLSNLSVTFIPSGGYANLNVIMDIWGRDRMSHLSVYLQPYHTTDLAVSVTPV